jgi:flagellar protein FliS
MMNSAVAQRKAYVRDQILAATPARLLTMLYDRLLLDLNRAEAAQLEERWVEASEQLKHAQAIIAELSSSLKLGTWDGAEGLLATYNYVGTALINANIHRDVERIREAIRLVQPLHESWHEAASSLQASSPPAAPGLGGGIGVA